MRTAVTDYVALGANLGNPIAALKDAIAAIAQLPHTQLQAQSSMYASAPLDSSGPDYVNAVVQIETLLTAPALLAALQFIESAAGRQRPYRNAPRTLDLDLVLFGQGRIDSATLTIPHPRMGERAFVLLPLAQLNKALVSDAQHQAIKDQRIEKLNDF